MTVTASRDNSTISVTAITDDQGRYSFPADRLGPGAYALSIRATGYDLDGKAAATVAAEQTVGDRCERWIGGSCRRRASVEHTARQIDRRRGIRRVVAQDARVVDCLGCWLHRIWRC